MPTLLRPARTMSEADKTICIPNGILLEQVSQFLSEGREVTLRAKGYSMLPFIRHTEDSVILKRFGTYAPGDIVLARLANGDYVLHRIRAVDGNGITLAGDGNLWGTERCASEDICGTAIGIVKRNGRNVNCRSASQLRLARIWNGINPKAKRWILAFYRRLTGVPKLRNN